MSRHCRSCGCSIDDRPPKHFLCLRCYGAAARELRTGKEKLSPTCAGVGLSVARVDQLLRLLDQPNRREAEAVASWLKTTRQILTSGDEANV